MSNATVVNQKTSLTLPSGGQLYFFALATDRTAGTGYFVNFLSSIQSPYSVINAVGYHVASVAVTTSNATSYTTSTKSYAIAGASVSGFASATGALAGTFSIPV
jgi:hypothetical protein